MLCDDDVLRGGGGTGKVTLWLKGYKETNRAPESKKDENNRYPYQFVVDLRDGGRYSFVHVETAIAVVVNNLDSFLCVCVCVCVCVCQILRLHMSSPPFMYTIHCLLN